MAQVKQKLTRFKKELLRVGSGPPRNCSGRVLTRPIPTCHLITLEACALSPPPQMSQKPVLPPQTHKFAANLKTA